jgi:hypothetical protein
VLVPMTLSAESATATPVITEIKSNANHNHVALKTLASLSPKMKNIYKYSPAEAR